MVLKLRAHGASAPIYAAGIMAFEGKADLHGAEAQQDCADGFDGAEHKVAQIVDPPHNPMFSPRFAKLCLIVLLWLCQLH